MNIPSNLTFSDNVLAIRLSLFGYMALPAKYSVWVSQFSMICRCLCYLDGNEPAGV